MIGRQIEEKEGNRVGRFRSSQRERMMCPVCGKEIHEVNLPDVKSVVEDRLAWVGFIIVDSFVCLLVGCEPWMNCMNLLQSLRANLTAKVNVLTLK